MTLALDERFWSKVDLLAPSGCWEWTSARNEHGYGLLASAGERRAHRLALADQGVDVTGWVVRHKCDNPPCVNPAHLEIGTQRDNARDMAARGRSVRGTRNKAAVLDEQRVATIKTRLRDGERGADLAQEYGVGRSTISRIARGVGWAHVAPAKAVLGVALDRE